MRTIDVDALSNEIRRVDGSNKLGAGAIAEALIPFISAHASEANVTAEVSKRYADMRLVAMMEGATPAEAMQLVLQDFAASLPVVGTANMPTLTGNSLRGPALTADVPTSHLSSSSKHMRRAAELLRQMAKAGVPKHMRDSAESIAKSLDYSLQVKSQPSSSLKAPMLSKAEWQSILDQMQAASDPDQRTPFEQQVMRKIERAAIESPAASQTVSKEVGGLSKAEIADLLSVARPWLLTLGERAHRDGDNWSWGVADLVSLIESLLAQGSVAAYRDMSPQLGTTEAKA